MKSVSVYILICTILLSKLANAQLAREQNSMLLIPAGDYQPLYAGANEVKTLEAFYMDRYPVTNKDFSQFVSENPEWGKQQIKSLFADNGYLRHWKGNNTFDSGLSNSPVVNVSWFAAQKYCECQGKRLPTTDEWERVASAGINSVDGSREKAYQQWILDVTSKPQKKPVPDVGTTKQNFFGVWDMHGLIWEWTYDFNSRLITGESRGGDSGSGLFCAGGATQSNDVQNYPAFLRDALRSSLKGSYVLQNLGFRCVSEAKAPALVK